MNKTRRLIFLIISAIATLAVMATIFYFSNQGGEASSEASNSTGSVILEILHIEVPEGESPDTVPIVFSFTIRSLAHILLFSLLGVTGYLFFTAVFAFREKRQFDSVYVALCALALCLIYACLDELHQMFIDGRSATFRDVGIDAIGFCFTIALCCIVAAVVKVLRGKRKI